MSLIFLPRSIGSARDYRAHAAAQGQADAATTCQTLIAAALKLPRILANVEKSEMGSFS
jgi:hypothetical protein